MFLFITVVFKTMCDRDTESNCKPQLPEEGIS